MILGIGVDAVEIKRISQLNDKTLEKILSQDELSEYLTLREKNQIRANEFAASRFAVKEAYSKARGTGFSSVVVPGEISVCKDENGCPLIRLSGKTAHNAPDCDIKVSITHENPLAVAFVVLQTKEGENGQK